MNRILIAVVAASLATPVFADSFSIWENLPITSDTYGDPTVEGCKAFKEETEGGYISFDRKGWGAYGEVSCELKSLKKTGDKKYSVTARCTFGEAPNTQTDTYKLEIINDKTILWDEQKMVRCPPNPNEGEDR